MDRAGFKPFIFPKTDSVDLQKDHSNSMKSAKLYTLLSDSTGEYGDDNVFYRGVPRRYTGGPWTTVEFNIFNSCDNAKAYRSGTHGFPKNTKAEIRELTVASELGSEAAKNYLINEEKNLKRNLSDCPETAEKMWNQATRLGTHIAMDIFERQASTIASHLNMTVQELIEESTNPTSSG